MDDLSIWPTQDMRVLSEGGEAISPVLCVLAGGDLTMDLPYALMLLGQSCGCDCPRTLLKDNGRIVPACLNIFARQDNLLGHYDDHTREVVTFLENMLIMALVSLPAYWFGSVC